MCVGTTAIPQQKHDPFNAAKWLYDPQLRAVYTADADGVPSEFVCSVSLDAYEHVIPSDERAIREASMGNFIAALGTQVMKLQAGIVKADKMLEQAIEIGAGDRV